MKSIEFRRVNAAPQACHSAETVGENAIGPAVAAPVASSPIERQSDDEPLDYSLLVDGESCYRLCDLALKALSSSTGRMSLLTDEQIASVGAAVPAGRGYTERRDRAIADASAAFAISSIWRSEWVPVTERLPETHDESIGWLVFDGENVSHCRNHPSWWNYKDDRGTEHDGQKVTHWMPIPKGPK